MTPTEQLGAEAISARSSAGYAAAKSERAYQDRSWSVEDAEGPQPIHPPNEILGEAGPDAEAAPAPLSRRMTGNIAVGLVIVSGVQSHLSFSQAEQTKVVAEMQNGLSWLGAQSPAQDVTFVHDIQVLTVNVPDTTNGQGYEAFEAPWRDAALAQMGYDSGISGVRAHAEHLRSSLSTQWAYVAFFTKYRLWHFAYASLGGPRLVMHYENDGWGPENIDRVFAHETGHIFNAPDEYAASGCNCGGSWGHFDRPNSNCANCAPGGGVSCIMRSNAWTMCSQTPYHLGFNGLP